MRKRVIETSHGIQEESNVQIYNQMQKNLRDKGWIETNDIIKSGLTSGVALEIGSGPGYLGLEWLKKTSGTSLKAVEISQSMITVAQRNAEEYGVTSRCEYKNGRGEAIPFEDDAFDSVFTNGSLHEWSEPEKVFDEIFRILKPEGVYYISDLKRNMNPLIAWFLQINVKPKEIRLGLKNSIAAAYLKSEIEETLARSKLNSAQVSENLLGLKIKGVKRTTG
ncbi:MAG TPA: class I SAM-dependent methyltransferase [Methanocella sp.]|nr:class I SAM-dependent methyltransferase [Methanocella sp.]